MSKADKPLPPLSQLEPRIALSRTLALLGYLALLICLVVYNGFILDLHGANPLVILGVLVIPLLIFLPGILIGHVRTHAWLCFAINLYFMYGVQTCFVPGKAGYGGWLVASSVIYFVAALGYVRWSYQAERVRQGMA